MRTLILGAMPEGTTPETHVPSGPWCFVGREEAFPGWDEGLFPLPGDPFLQPGSMETLARSANAESLRLTDLLADFLARQYKLKRSSGFWEMALLPFVLLFTHMMAERNGRIEDLIRLYGKEPLRVEILPKGAYFSFATTRDFMVYGVQDQGFNHYILSRLVEYSKPEAWELVSLPPAQLNIVEEEEPPAFARRVWKKAVDLARRLPFPWQKSFGSGRCLLLSLAVLLNKDKPDKTLGFAPYGEDPLNWPNAILGLIRACVPKELRQGLAELAVKPQAGNLIEGRRPSCGPLQGMLPLYSQDDRYRLFLAEKVECGTRLFCIQHGSNYGQLASPGLIPFEYARHAFFSWGWEQHGELPGNVTPMAHPILTNLYGRHAEKRAELILVGTEMSTYAYRLKSRPLASAMPAYRQDKVRFIKAFIAKMTAKGDTPEAALALLSYRPYFPVAGGLDDAAYVRRAVPGIALCQGDLTERMLSCRLLVLDHYGTTLHMAMAANAPVMAYWDRKAWAMDTVTEQYLERFARAGILHADSLATADFAASVWSDVAAWWQGEAVQEARQAWLWRYARSCQENGAPYGRTELTRVWFSALHRC